MPARTVFCCLLVLTLGTGGFAQQKHVAPRPRAGFQISGTLVDAISGQAIAHAHVAIAPVTQRDAFTTVITGEDGRFLFSNLAPGKYTLTAQAHGYLLQSFNQHEGFASSIAVGPDLDSGNLLFRLPLESAISGVITDEAGEPVREAQVTLYFTGLAAGTEATRLRGRTTTDDEGAYRFGHLASGRYIIAVSAKPWYAQYGPPEFTAKVGPSEGIQSVLTVDKALGASDSRNQENSQLDVAYPVTFYSGSTDAAQATPIVIGIGDKFDADISLQPVPAMHVRIRTGGGPEHTTFFTLERRVLDGPAIQVPTQMRSEGPGMQEIDGIPAGHYTIKAYTAGKDSAGEWGPPREIEINDEGEIDRDHGSSYVPITATLQFASGNLPSQAWLQLLNKKSREVFSAPIKGDKEIPFRQSVPPGSYEVSIINTPGIYLKNISATGAKVSGRTVEVQPGHPAKLAIRASRGEGEITGTALRNGKPFAGAMIVLVPADPAHNQVLFRRDQSDSDGTFTLPQVVPGAYTVLALENGWKVEWMNPEVLKNYLPGGTEIQAQPNGKYNVKVTVQ